MRSPTYALIWEQWRQVRAVVAISLATMLALRLMPSKLLGGEISRDDILSTAFAIAMLFTAAALLFTRSSIVSLYIPQRMMVLPVSRWRLAAALLGFRIGMFSSMGAILSYLLGAGHVDTAMIVMLSACAMSIAVAVAWSPGKVSAIRGIAALLLVPIPMMYTAIAGTLYAYNRYYWYLYIVDRQRWEQRNPAQVPLEYLYAAPAVVLILISAVVAVRTVVPRNHRMWKSNRPYLKIRPLRVFNLEKQLGFELRHSFAWYPTITSAVLLLFLFPLIDIERFFQRPLDVFREIESPAIFLVSALATGLFIMLYDQRYTAVSTMMFTRPVNTGTLALSRFWSAFVSIFMVNAIGFLLTWSLLPNENLLASSLYSLWVSAVVCFGAITLIWIPFQAMLMGVWMLLVAGLGSALYSPQPPHHLYALAFFVWLPSIVYVWRFCSVLRTSISTGLLTREIGKTALGCSATTLFMVCWIPFDTSAEPVVAAYEILSIAAALCLVATLPAYALLSHTLWLDKVRHGKPTLSTTPRILQEA